MMLRRNLQAAGIVYVYLISLTPLLFCITICANSANKAYEKEELQYALTSDKMQF